MTIENFSWTNSNNLRIQGRHWPVEKPKAVISLVHGFGEHIGRYEHVAAYFNERNTAVIGYDRSGHGLSEGKRGHTKNYAVLLDEIGELIRQTRGRYPGVPLVLYGHSQGGNLALNYALRREAGLSGIVATGPWIKLAFEPSGFLVFLGKLTRMIYPAFSQPNNLNADHLSTDAEVGKAYVADPLVHNRVTSETGLSMIESGAYLDQYKGPFPCPLLLMHGGADQITSPEATRDFASRLEGDVTLKIWDGLYHEIHNEYRQAEVLDAIWSWMQVKVIP